MNKQDIYNLFIDNQIILDISILDKPIFIIDRPKVAEILAEKLDIEKHYKEWCRLTKRNGSVLVGGSIREFFEYLKTL